MAKRWWWVALGVVVVGAWAARTDDHPKAVDASQSTATAKPTPTPTPRPSTPTTPKPWYDDYDPAHFAPQVRRYAQQAGVSPQLLMAILYNESYKPHDPVFERSWARIDSNPAFGIANMHRAAFDDTKRGRDFAGRKWEQLPDDPSLAIEAAAWHLHDLAKRLPDKRSQRYTKDELLALGYNTGAGNMRAFAKGAKAGTQAQSYLDKLHANWPKSATALNS